MAARDDPTENGADHQLEELVQELRLVLPGATVLFGFLLSVPFSSRFDLLTTLDRVIYMVAFLSAALALVLLLAEAGYHQIQGKPYDKHLMVRTSSRQAVAGLAWLGVSLLACVVLVADFVYGAVLAVAVAVPLGAGAVWLWFGLPLMRRLRGDPSG
ncbi:MAG: DUF6328 family protein [Ilumatobacteraceae bacterium]|nr:DUF6328 family protein [Ilumatobacteraceae bacterium]